MTCPSTNGRDVPASMLPAHCGRRSLNAGKRMEETELHGVSHPEDRDGVDRKREHGAPVARIVDQRKAAAAVARQTASTISIGIHHVPVAR